MYNLLVSLFLLVPLTHGQDEQSCPFEIVTDLGPHDCFPDKAYYSEHSEQNYCLPYCVKYSTRPPTPATCANYPGYKLSNKQCVPDPEVCAIYYASFSSNNYFRSLFRPTCQKNLGFAPKQCKGDIPTGRCYCFDDKGHRLFGHQWASKAENMTCACSRRRADLEVSNSARFVSLHCDSVGNYEPLQCDVESAQCWCVEPMTGELTSTVVPDKAMNRLPCYNLDKNGGQYLRQCDSWIYGQYKILQELSRHGTNNIQFTPVFCDGDGAYGKYSITEGAAYCTWRDGKRIKSWQDSMLLINTLDCNCARDSIIYENAGKEKVQQCAINGNYNPYQQIGVSAYCVDSDGFKNTNSIPQNKDDCLLS